MDDHERTRPPLTAGEVDTLLGFLEHFRDTLRWKTEGLDAAQLTRRLGPSTMTLGGLLKHLTLVEDWWFSVALLDHDWDQTFRDVDWDADEDWDWHSAAADSAEQLRAEFDRLVAASDANLAAMLVDGSLDTLAARAGRSGERRSLRWILVHMIEEYARHCGHADLLRESIDGQVGA